MIAETYALQIHQSPLGSSPLTTGELKSALLEAEENLTDLLPNGWKVTIRRWDDPDGAPRKDDEDE
jgi:hypothetical protein